MNKDISSDVYSVIIDVVVTGTHSPYNEMIKKAKDIDIDFFEKVSRGTNSLSEELNLELKDKVVDAFSKMADNYYVGSALESRILALVQDRADAIKNTDGENACKEYIKSLSECLEVYAKGSNIHAGFPKYTNEIVTELYEHARHITLKEFFMGGNDQDILNFYNALVDNTWWTCREVVVNKTNDFLLALAAKTRKIGAIQQ